MSLLPEHLPPIKIKTVNEQRYDTAGDYQYTGNGWVFSISRRKSIDDEFLILIHEMVEWYLTQKNGVPEPEITMFDIEHENSPDPGSEKDSPYREEHLAAMVIEKKVKQYIDANACPRRNGLH